MGVADESIDFAHTAKLLWEWKLDNDNGENPPVYKWNGSKTSEDDHPSFYDIAKTYTHWINAFKFFRSEVTGINNTIMRVQKGVALAH